MMLDTPIRPSNSSDFDTLSFVLVLRYLNGTPSTTVPVDTGTVIGVASSTV